MVLAGGASVGPRNNMYCISEQILFLGKESIEHRSIHTHIISAISSFIFLEFSHKF